MTAPLTRAQVDEMEMQRGCCRSCDEDDIARLVADLKRLDDMLVALARRFQELRAGDEYDVHRLWAPGPFRDLLDEAFRRAQERP